MTKISILYGPHVINFDVPENNLMTVAKPQKIPSISDITVEVKRAIDTPIASKKFSDLIMPSKKIAIFIDDPTRPTPGNLILPVILDELKKLKVSRKNIKIIIGGGGHYAGGLFFLNDAITKIGRDIATNYEWLVHEPGDDMRLKFLGTTSYDTPVYVNKYIAEADVKIGIGSIFIHRIAGYGGGAKMVLPGVAGQKSIQHNHFNVALSDRIDPCMIGTIENPVRQDMEEAAKLLGVDMMINVVMNPSTKEVIKIYAGDIIKSHRLGIETYNKIFQVPMNTADATIVSSNHLWLSLSHGLKAICVADMACRVRMLPGEIGYDNLVHHIKMPPEKIKENLLKGEFKGSIVSSGSMMVSYSLTRRRHPILIMSESWSPEQAAPLTYEYVSNIETTIQRILEIAGDDAQINVIDMGNAVIPQLS